MDMFSNMETLTELNYTVEKQNKKKHKIFLFTKPVLHHESHASQCYMTYCVMMYYCAEEGKVP